MSSPDGTHSCYSLLSRVWLCGLFLLLAVIETSAEQLPTRVYTTADGLGSSTINHIMRDSRGFLWFCTRDGLSRFDGVRFTTYSIGQNPSYPTINHILETSGGAYLIATNGGGIHRFDPNVVSLSVRAPDQRDERVTLNTEKVGDFGARALYEDSQGKLWAADDGLYQLEVTGNRLSFHRVELNSPARPGKTFTITGFKEAQDGSLWLSTGYSAIRRLPDGRTIEYVLAPMPRGAPIMALEEDRNGRIWIAHREGVYVLRPETLTSLSDVEQYAVRPFSQIKRSIDSLASDSFSRLREGDAVHFDITDSVSGLLQTSDGRMWIAADRKLTMFDGEARQTFSYSEGLTENNAGVLAEDLEGNLWIGNQSGGARKVLRNGMVTFGRSEGLGDVKIHSIYEDQAGELYVVNGDFLISRLEGKSFKTVRPNLAAAGWPVWTSNVAFYDSVGDWWIQTTLGLYRFSGIRALEELSRRQPTVYADREGLKSLNPYRIFEDKSGDLWIGTRSDHRELNGLTKWQRATNKFQVFSERERLPPLLAPSAFAQDKSGNLWIGFYEGGLARYADGQFTVFGADDGAPRGPITGLYLDRGDRLWIASSMGGLSRVDDPGASGPPFETYTTTSGLSSDNVRCIVEDLAGNIYVGTVRGVDRLDPTTGNIHHYGLSDGLADDFVNVAYRDRKGALWFGTARGLSRHQPEIGRVRSAPPILINGLHIAGVKQAVSELGQWKINALELDHTQNNIQVEFFSLDFSLGENIRYQFKLEGADSDWSPPSTQRTVTYPNIAPGNYRFLVRAVNPDGVASASPAFIPFKISPPIWLRWWFLTLTVLVLGMLIYGSYRYRLTTLLEIERTRTRIATDLHDDIGASLSRIAMLSEVVKRQSDRQNQTSVRRLTQIADNARDLVDSMSDIVWSIDPRRDSLSSVLARVRSFAADTLGECGVKWTLEVPPEVGEVYLSSEKRRVLYLILKEAVINIARHAKCQNARIKVSLNQRDLIAEISDDGVGLSQESSYDSRGGHGLENMRKRASEVGGQLGSSSSKDGTKLVLIIPRVETKSISMLFRRSRKQ